MFKKLISGSYHDFLYRGLLLTRKLLNQGFLFAYKLKSSLQKFYGRHHDLVTRYNQSQITMNIFHLSYALSGHLLIITGFVTRVTRRVPHEEQELPTLPEHQSSPPVFSGVRVSRSLVFCVVFCRSLFVPLSSGHYVVCPSIYGL